MNRTAYHALQRRNTGPRWGDVLLLIVICIVFAIMVSWMRPAHAADVSYTWNNPATHTDSTPIPATGQGSLASGRLEFGTCNGTAFGTKAGEMPITLAQVQARAATLTNILPSTLCARLYVSTTFGAESAASNVALKVIAPSIPGPPTGLAATSPVAYDMRPLEDGRFMAVAIGRIPKGLACSPDQVTANGVEYHRIDLSGADLIDWPREADSPTAWAVCS